MRASSARLTNSPIRLAELSFPQADRLIHRTRLAFIHLDNLLAFAKRDRDGRVDGYLAAYLPEECLLVFLRRGEAVNAASLGPGGRDVVTIADALTRMRAELERGELTYCTAPAEQLAWMYQSCAVPLIPLPFDSGEPASLLRQLQHAKTGGVLEWISDGQVSYLAIESGQAVRGYFSDNPDLLPAAQFLEREIGNAGYRRAGISAALFPAMAELPHQAPESLINTYREVYWRIV